MRPIPHKFLLTAAVFGSLLAGCEWTSSDGTSTWSSRYDTMNFSGNYRITLASGGNADGTATGTPTVGSVSGATVGSCSGTGFSQTLRPDLVPGSVSVSVVVGGNTYSWKDDGAGVLVAQTAPQTKSGTVAYSSGAITLTFSGTLSGTVKASYSYNYVTAIEGDGETLTHITVKQNGQHLEMLFSNGLNMAGKFTTVNELVSGYNASFEVSGNGSRFVGTLNSTTAERILDGTLVYKGGNYDINARTIGSAGTTASN